MIPLACPNCGLLFVVFAVDSCGSCGCGLDYELNLEGVGRITWTPDPADPQSGVREYICPVPWPGWDAAVDRVKLAAEWIQSREPGDPRVLCIACGGLRSPAEALCTCMLTGPPNPYTLAR